MKNKFFKIAVAWTVWVMAQYVLGGLAGSIIGQIIPIFIDSENDGAAIVGWVHTASTAAYYAISLIAFSVVAYVFFLMPKNENL